MDDVVAAGMIPAGSPAARWVRGRGGADLLGLIQGQGGGADLPLALFYFLVKFL